MLKSYLHGTQNLGLIVASSLALISGSSFLATYETYLRFVLFLPKASLLLLEWYQLFSLCPGYFNRETLFFLSTTSSTSIWAVTHCRTSNNFSVEFLISESLNRLANIPCSSDDYHLHILCLKSYQDCI